MSNGDASQNKARAQRAFFASPGMAMSPRGAFAVTPNMAMPWYPFPTMAAQPASLLEMASVLPKPLIRALLDELDKTKPQRKTDIYYEDEDVVHVRRSGVEYTLWPPASLVWLRMGKADTGALAKEVAEKLGATDMDDLRLVIGDFLIAAAASDLVILYPDEVSKENLSPSQEEH